MHLEPWQQFVFILLVGSVGFLIGHGSIAIAGKAGRIAMKGMAAFVLLGTTGYFIGTMPFDNAFQPILILSAGAGLIGGLFVARRQVLRQKAEQHDDDPPEQS